MGSVWYGAHGQAGGSFSSPYPTHQPAANTAGDQRSEWASKTSTQSHSQEKQNKGTHGQHLFSSIYSPAVLNML